MKNNGKKLYLFILTLIGILGSFFFILMGYWIAAAIGFMQTDGKKFFESFNKVLDNPFSSYFNNYTPIVMILGFIIFEFLFFLFLVSSRKSMRIDEAELDEDEMFTIPLNNSNSVFEGIISDSIQESKESTASNIIEDYGIVIPSDEEQEISDSDETSGQSDALEIEEGISQEREISFSEDIVVELLSTYDMEQITAMLKLSKYMNIRNTEQLRKMFDPGMSANEITEYIEIFYGEEV